MRERPWVYGVVFDPPALKFPVASLGKVRALLLSRESALYIGYSAAGALGVASAVTATVAATSTAAATSPLPPPLPEWRGLFITKSVSLMQTLPLAGRGRPIQ